MRLAEQSAPSQPFFIGSPREVMESQPCTTTVNSWTSSWGPSTFSTTYRTRRSISRQSTTSSFSTTSTSTITDTTLSPTTHDYVTQVVVGPTGSYTTTIDLNAQATALANEQPVTQSHPGLTTLEIGAIIGAVFGFLIFLLIVFCFVFSIRRRRRYSGRLPRSPRPQKPRPPKPPAPPKPQMATKGGPVVPIKPSGRQKNTITPKKTPAPEVKGRAGKTTTTVVTAATKTSRPAKSSMPAPPPAAKKGAPAKTAAADKVPPTTTQKGRRVTVEVAQKSAAQPATSARGTGARQQSSARTKVVESVTVQTQNRQQTRETKAPLRPQPARTRV